MAETTKKAKAPGKPRSTASKKVKAPEEKAASPSHQQIAQLAQTFWAERGYQEGYAEQDWLKAERELHSA